MDFLPGSLGFDPLAHTVDPHLGARVLWFDAFVGNVDRSWRNPNLLMWHRELCLIDHGATLVFHHSWAQAQAGLTKPYDVSGHVLSSTAGAEARFEADADLGSRVTKALLTAVLSDVPEAWLIGEPGFASPDDGRAAYGQHLLARLAARDRWRP